MRTAIAAVVSSLTLLACIATPAGAQAPTQDSVVGSGTAAFAAQPASAVGFNLDARSGPSGENAAGTAGVFLISVPSLRIAGTVTCLNVSGNRAVIGIDNSLGDPGFGMGSFIEVTDDTPDLLQFQPSIPSGQPPTVCPADLQFASDYQVLSGDIVVTDAPPFPTSKQQCTNGGWQNFGSMFKNQGQCVAYVEQGPKG